MSCKHFVSKNQLSGFYITETLVENELINCKYANTFFSLSVNIKEFCWNVKGLEIDNKMNTWKKCSCWKWRNIFCKRLIKYFAWKNYLGQSTRGNWGGSYLDGNYPGVIIRGTIIQTPIVRGQFFWWPFLRAIIWEAIILGTIAWGQWFWGSTVRGAIVLRAIFRGAIIRGQVYGDNYLRGNYSGGNWPKTNRKYYN